MYQTYFPKDYASCFREAMPRLAYTWHRKADAEYAPPRILHRHKDTTELMLFTGGTASYTMDDVRYTIKEGDLLIINAGVRHDEDARMAQHTRMFGVGIERLKVKDLPDYLLIPPTANPVLSLSDKDYHAVYELMHLINQLAEESEQNTELCQMLGCSLVCLVRQIVAGNLHEEAAMPGDRMLTTRIQDYIETHYAEDIDLKTIGRALHISSYYLAHVFKESTGYPLMQYVIRLRMGKAQELLQYTSYSITQIAGMVGYDNASHFNTMFTKNIGMSPGKYRKSFTAAEKKGL